MSSYSPELITSCKETQLTRLQCSAVQLGSWASQPRRHSLKVINLCLLVSCILSGLVGLAYLAFDPLVRSLILKKMVLSTSSENFKMWEDPPISPHLKVFFFNLTNAREVFDGLSKPQLQEIGPYTYSQQWIKQNITWHDNGTISYRTRKVFTYNSSLSCPSCLESDLITTLNVPALSAYYKSRSTWVPSALEGVMWFYGHKTYLTRTVKELLWGYHEPLFAAAKLTGEEIPFSDFALFQGKNSSKDEDIPLYTMYTGAGNPYNLAKIQSFNGVSEMSHWNDSECDAVRGSDGASFNPYIKKAETLWFFNDQMCRAMPLTFDREVVHKGLPGLRFQPREDVFMSAKKFPKNSCYAQKDHEVGEGIFDVRVCQHDAPIVLSWPHFLHAEAKYSGGVQGLTPDPDKHGFWFDIQQVTGTTLSAKARIQINMKVQKIPSFVDLSKINDTLIPILWFEEGIDELGDDIIDVLKGAAVSPGEWRQYILYCLIGLVSTMTVLCLVAVFRLVANRANVARVERLRRILMAQGQLDPAHKDFSVQDSSTQPMLAGILDSSDSSRSSSATHSRTSSEGVTPAYAVLPPPRGASVVHLSPSGTSSQHVSV